MSLILSSFSEEVKCDKERNGVICYMSKGDLNTAMVWGKKFQTDEAVCLKFDPNVTELRGVLETLSPSLLGLHKCCSSPCMTSLPSYPS